MRQQRKRWLMKSSQEFVIGQEYHPAHLGEARMLNVQGIEQILALHPFRGVSLEVPSGTMCGLIGGMELAKTTFMRMGALEAKTGGMEFNGENIGKLLLTIALMSVLGSCQGIGA